MRRTRMPTFSETYPSLFESPFLDKAVVDEQVKEAIALINNRGPHYKASTTYKVIELATEFEVTLNGNRAFTVGKSISMNQLITKIYWFYHMRSFPKIFDYIKANINPEALSNLQRLISDVKTLAHRSKEDLANKRIEEAKRELIAHMDKIGKKY